MENFQDLCFEWQKEKTLKELEKHFDVLDKVELDPYEKMHMFVVMRYKKWSEKRSRVGGRGLLYTYREYLRRVYPFPNTTPTPKPKIRKKLHTSGQEELSSHIWYLASFFIEHNIFYFQHIITLPKQFRVCNKHYSRIS